MDYRRALRDELAVAGTPAVAMLAGTSPLDPIVVMSALKAAGLLGERGSGQPELWRQLERGARGPLMGRVLDLVAREPEAPEGDDPDERLLAIVALAGVAAMTGGAHRERLDMALAGVEAEGALSGGHEPALAEYACALMDALDLDAEHPAAQLLGVFASAPVPELEGAFARGRTRAANGLFPGLLARWVLRLRGVNSQFADWVEAQAATPILAFADDELPAPIPQRRLVAARADAEVCLLRRGDDLVLEWLGDGAAPTGAFLGDDGRPLERAESLVEGAVSWRLGEPPVGAPTVRLVSADAADWCFTLAS